MTEKTNDITDIETATDNTIDHPTGHPTDNIADNMEEPEEPSPATEKERIAHNRNEQPVVVIRGLKKSFKDHHVLNGVNIEVHKGENLVVLGKSGSGKSVLIKCLVGLEYPDEGSIEV